MQQEVSLKQTQEEIKSGYKPPVMESFFQALPFNNLGDRDFELLVYSLIKAEIENRVFTDAVKVSLMQGVGERGRDCVLYDANGVCGIIQCKKYNNRISKTTILKELIKFALHVFKDPTLISNKKEINYYFYVSNDLSGPAIDLINEYKRIIINEIEEGKIDKHIDEIVEEYENFRLERANTPYEEVKNILVGFSVFSINAIDLTHRLYNQPHILQNFFNIQKVISIDSADKTMRSVLDDYGLKFLTDIDLKFIQERISESDPDHRVNFGIIDFYGYSPEFFKSLDPNELEKILGHAVGLQKELNSKLVRYFSTEMQKLILQKVTHDLLSKGLIHPYSVNICTQYLILKLSPIVLGINVFNVDQKAEKEIPTEFALKKAIDGLLNGSQRVLDGDFSQWTGDFETIQSRKELYEHIHMGFNNIEDIKKGLEQDIKILMPVLHNIEAILYGLFSKSKTIVLSDISLIENENRLKRILDSISKLDK